MAGGVKHWRKDTNIKAINLDEEEITSQPAGNDDCPQSKMV